MILIEYYPCTNSFEAEARERYYTELLNSDMNTYTPNALNSIGKVEYNLQYYEQYKETIKLRTKQYYTQNKEQIRTKQCVKFSCECGGSYTYVNKIPHFKTIKHQDFINENYEWTYWWDEIQCTEEDYNICHFA
jgi:hypothetical protein